MCVFVPIEATCNKRSTAMRIRIPQNSFTATKITEFDVFPREIHKNVTGLEVTMHNVVGVKEMKFLI